MKGLRVSVLRNAEFGDCSNDGASSKHDSFLLIGEGIEGPWTLEEAMSEGFPVLRLVKRNLRGQDYYHAEPLELDAKKGSPMFGGNFIYTSDSRFRRVCPYPIAIHDRQE